MSKRTSLFEERMDEWGLVGVFKSWIRKDLVLVVALAGFGLVVGWSRWPDVGILLLVVIAAGMGLYGYRLAWMVRQVGAEIRKLKVDVALKGLNGRDTDEETLLRLRNLEDRYEKFARRAWKVTVAVHVVSAAIFAAVVAFLVLTRYA